MAIENTARTAKENPMAMFAEALMGGDRFVETQEARGQAQVVASQQLPAEGDWEALEALGFIKGEPVEGDDLFVNATIPEGWYKEATNHSMYSVIKDERGVERVTVGYKAAFYDRWAQINTKNVGNDIANSLVYGDDPVTKPALWDVLTVEERGESLRRVKSHLQERTEFVEQFGKGDDEYYSNQIARGEQAVKLLSDLWDAQVTADGQ